MMTNIINGCKNTIWKKIKSDKEEIWCLMYKNSFLNSFPLINNFESFNGIIAWFIVLNKDKKRHLLLLPEKTIGNTNSDFLKWYYEKPVYDNDGFLDMKEEIPPNFFRNNTFKALQYALFNLGSSSPKDMFNNFFREANISSANLSGSYPLCPGNDWTSSSKIPENYPCVYENNIFTMKNWSKNMKGNILSSASNINFYKNDELPKNISIPTEWHTLIKNTGNLKIIDMNKNSFISSKYIKNYWFNDINYHELNTLKIAKAPMLEYINIKLPKNTHLDISGAQSLNDIDVVNTINKITCYRVMRSMIPDINNYNFINNLFKKNKPLAHYISIKMGYFFYTGKWEGLHDYIEEFFDWLKHRKYKEINEKVMLLEEKY